MVVCDNCGGLHDIVDCPELIEEDEEYERSSS
jgi:hypothetical protein